MGREIVSIATALVPYPPERVWAVVTDLDCWQWRSDLSRLDHVGEDAFTEYDRSGFPTRFTVTERRPLSRWAFDLDNANLAGRWAGEFRPEGGGTQVTFTETITVKKPWMRFFAKGYLRRQQARYLADLGRIALPLRSSARVGPRAGVRAAFPVAAGPQTPQLPSGFPGPVGAAPGPPELPERVSGLAPLPPD